MPPEPALSQSPDPSREGEGETKGQAPPPPPRPLLSRVSIYIFFALLVGAVALAIGGLFLTISVRSIRDATEHAQERNLNVALSAAGHFNELVQRNMDMVISAAASPLIDLGDGDMGHEEHLLQTAFPPGSAYYQAVFLAGRAGQVVAIQPSMPSLLASSQAGEEYFQQALATGQPYVGEKVKVQEGIPILVLAAPLARGQGVLGLYLDLAHPRIVESLSRGILGATGYVEVIDGTGTVVASTRPEHLLRMNDHAPDLLPLMLARSQAVITSPDVEEPGRRDVVALAPLNSIPSWSLVVEQDEREAFADVAALHRRMWWALGIALALALVPALAAAHLIVRPLHALAGAAGRMSRHDLATPVPPRGLGEMASLAQGLNRMRVDLGTSLADNARLLEEARRRAGLLEGLYRGASALASTLEVRQVLGQALEGLPLAPTTTTAAIVLLDEAGDRARVAAARGLHAPALEGIELERQALPPPLWDRLFRSREPLIVPELGQLPPSIPARHLVESYRNFAILPLVSGQRHLGLIALADVTGATPSPGEMAIYSIFASQVAAAVDNARLYQQTDERLRQRVAQLEALMRLTHALATTLDLEEVLGAAARQAARALGAERSLIFLVEGDEVYTAAAYQEGLAQAPLGRGQRWPLKDAWHIQRALESRRPLVIPQWRQEKLGPVERQVMAEVGVKSSLIAPLLAGERALGTLHVNEISRERAYTQEEVELLQLMASYVASAVENARLYQGEQVEHQRLQAVIDNMPEGVALVSSPEGKVYMANAAAQRMMGQPIHPDSSFNRRGQDYGVLQPDGRPFPLEQLPTYRSLRLGETVIGQEVLLRRPDGTELTVLFSCAPLWDASGLITDAVAIFQDITALKEVDRMKTEFIATASHELRTPLTAIYGFAELLLQRQASPEVQREWLEHIHQGAAHLKHLVEDLLDVSRIETGRVEIRPAPLALAPLVEEALANLRPRATGHTLTSHMPPDLPPVRADPERLRQVLDNLLSNAVDYSPQGGQVQVRARALPGQGLAEVAVSDEGIGIAPQDQRRIFARFYRVRRPEAEHVSGTGLGLHIVKSLVEQMGGRVWVESQEGRGSTFYFTLPQESSPPVGAAQEAQ